MLLLSFALALIFLMLITRPVSAEVSEPSPLISSRDHYPESGLTGDALIHAVNSFSGFYAVSTVNPDSSPNIALFSAPLSIRANSTCGSTWTRTRANTTS